MKLFAVPAVLQLSTAVASDPGWVWYRDQEYRCKVEYDHRMFKQGSKDSDQFQRFNGTYDDRIYFRVKGLKNDANWTPEEIRNQYLAKKPPGTLVYQKTKYDFLVLSGLRGQTIFYTRVAVSLDNTIICVLDINYPRAFKLQLDPVITRMSRSFGAK